MDMIKRNLWFIFMFIGAVGALLIWLFLPHQSQIDEAWWLIVKFIAFGFIVLGIGLFPNNLKYGHLLCCLPFIFFLCYIIPRLSYCGIFGTIQEPVEQGKFYTVLYLLCYPMIVMSVAYAFRMGGGSSGKSIKISIVGMLLIFSGLLDLCFNTVNGRPLAEHLDYAYHIIIILGHAPTWTGGLIFALCHIPIIIIVLLLPLDKWFEKWQIGSFAPQKSTSEMHHA